MGVSRLDINAIPTQMNLALHSLDPLCSTDNSQKSIFFDSLPPDFIILYKNCKKNRAKQGFNYAIISENVQL